MSEKEKPVPGTGGDIYIPIEKRTGEKSIVYITRNLSGEGLESIYDLVKAPLSGRIGIKLHTGEPDGPNIIPHDWVEKLVKERLPDAKIVETNVYYESPRQTTEGHREVLKTNGWTFCPVDIMDEEGTFLMPVPHGKWFTHMSEGTHVLNYDSILVLTHFKGHSQGGFGGSNKNVGIGFADGKEGKKWIHTAEGSSDQWSINREEIMERITESTEATVTHFKDHITYINVMRNMSVDCDCAGTTAAPVVTPDVGILGSLDILALDQACVDIVFAMASPQGDALRERILSRRGLRQLSYMKELGMGNDLYTLIDIETGKETTAKEVAANLK